jgi:hypothetical protein
MFVFFTQYDLYIQADWLTNIITPCGSPAGASIEPLDKLVTLAAIPVSTIYEGFSSKEVSSPLSLHLISYHRLSR